MKHRARGIKGAVLQHRRLRSVIRSVDAEFSSHIDECVDDLVAQGYALDDARVEAHRRFGDASSHRADILEAEMTPRSRWLVAAAAAFALVLTGSLVMGARQHRQALAHRELLAQLQDDVARLRAASLDPRAGLSIPMAQDIRFVTVDGAVQKPQVWTLGRRDDITLGEMLERSGWLASDASGTVFAVRMEPTGPGEVLRIALGGESWPKEIETVLEENYVIYAEPLQDASAPQGLSVLTSLTQ